MLPDDVLNDLLADPDLLVQIHLLERAGQKEVLRDRHLLLRIVALQFNNRHAVKENLVDLIEIVATEDKHHLAQINRNTGQVLILEVLILYRISQVDQQVLYLLALRGRANLVQLVKHENHAHALRRNKAVHDLTAVAALIDELVTRVRGRIRIATEADELEGPPERLRNSVLDETRLTNAGRTCQQK